eukprot:GEMP01098721.1.p1 GENE.GEMP01098721.1~~GEMP01098721.1.p1  ORF type:complete len:167 (+),score=31.90 GEMP01098721.1:104-604(+)
MGCGSVSPMTAISPEDEEAMENEARWSEFGSEVQVAVLKNGIVMDWLPAIALRERPKFLRVKIKANAKATKFGLSDKENEIPWTYVRRPEPPIPSIINPLRLPSEAIQKLVDRLEGRDVPYLKRLHKEVKTFLEESDVKDRLLIFVPSENLTKWTAAFSGPPGTCA